MRMSSVPRFLISVRTDIRLSALHCKEIIVHFAHAKSVSGILLPQYQQDTVPRPLFCLPDWLPMLHKGLCWYFTVLTWIYAKCVKKKNRIWFFKRTILPISDIRHDRIRDVRDCFRWHFNSIDLLQMVLNIPCTHSEWIHRNYPVVKKRRWVFSVLGLLQVQMCCFYLEEHELRLCRCHHWLQSSLCNRFDCCRNYLRRCQFSCSPDVRPFRLPRFLNKNGLSVFWADRFFLPILPLSSRENQSDPATGRWHLFLLANIVLLLKSIIFCQPFTQKILQGHDKIKNYIDSK